MANHWSTFPELRTKFLVDQMRLFAEDSHPRSAEAATVAFAFATNKTVTWRHKDAPQLDKRTNKEPF